MYLWKTCTTDNPKAVPGGAGYYIRVRSQRSAYLRVNDGHSTSYYAGTKGLQLYIHTSFVHGTGFKRIIRCKVSLASWIPN